MRQKADMMRLILDFASGDDRIRAVVLNGSRANPAAPADMFQDYDIVFAVRAVEPFVSDERWIARFGDILILQTPDRMDAPEATQFDRFAYLMLFMDGNRIDLTLLRDDRLDLLGEDSQTIVLLDKDGRIGAVPPPSNRDYLPVPPTAVQFYNCCNEFWWVSTYVAKGLWRRQFAYALRMYEGPVRGMLMRMLAWRIGVRTDFQAETGKEGKYFERYLTPDEWRRFLQTYPDGSYASAWEALEVMCGLFRESALETAGRFGYEYPAGEDRLVTAYLRDVRSLPPDAVDFRS